MFRVILLTLTALATLATYAVEPPDSLNIVNALTEDGQISIEQPQQMLKRLEYNPEATAEAKAEERQTNSRMGFRVEVFSDNNVRTAKARAAAKRTQITSRLPQYKVYVAFESPFWRVRLGDFATKASADAALAEVKRAFPSMASDLRVVRCQINR